MSMGVSVSVSTLVYLYAFPIWLLSSRINNVIASLCGRHKTLATNSPNNIRYTNIQIYKRNISTCWGGGGCHTIRGCCPLFADQAGHLESLMSASLWCNDLWLLFGLRVVRNWALHATCYKIYGTRVCATRGTVTPHSPAPSYSFLWPYALPLPHPQSFPVPGTHVGRICSAARREFSSFLNVYFIISFWRPTTNLLLHAAVLRAYLCDFCRSAAADTL